MWKQFNIFPFIRLKVKEEDNNNAAHLAGRTRLPGRAPAPRTFLHGPLEVVQHAVVVHPAQHLLLHQGELLAGGQLPLAGEAGEAGQVVHVALRPAHPVRGVDVAAAAGAPGAVPSAAGRRR